MAGKNALVGVRQAKRSFAKNRMFEHVKVAIASSATILYFLFRTSVASDVKVNCKRVATIEQSADTIATVGVTVGHTPDRYRVATKYGDITVARKHICRGCKPTTHNSNMFLLHLDN